MGTCGQARPRRVDDAPRSGAVRRDVRHLGIPYLLIKVAVEEMSPAMLVLGRTAIGAALLLPLAVARQELRPLLPYWLPVLAFAAIEIAIPWVLLGAAETEVSSSLTGLLVAAVPLVAVLIATTTGDRERFGLAT